MRDQHRPKQELINEVAALRKQVTDLKDAMTARRRVEDALRLAEEQLHALAAALSSVALLVDTAQIDYAQAENRAVPRR